MTPANPTTVAPAATTTTINSTLARGSGGPSADGTHAGSRLAPILRGVAFGLAGPDRPLLLSIEQEAARNPPDGPKWARREQASDLRHYYATYRTVLGVLKLAAEVETTPGTGRLLAIAAAEYDYLLQRQATRLADFDRTIDLQEYADEVAVAASFVGHARGDKDGYYWLNARGRCFPEWLFATSPRDQVELLAWAAIVWWRPAMQNIISRLPVGQREPAAREAVHVLGEHLQQLDCLYELARKVGPERKRWELGFGAVDAAIWLSASMVGWATETAKQIVDGGSDDVTTRLRVSVQVAMDATTAALRKLGEEREHTVFLDVWRQKSDMLKFAQATGGIGPDLEVLYHSRGSQFLGY